MDVVATSLADTAALLSAALDLKLVSLITGAMQAVDAGAARQGQFIRPEDRYEPRQVIEPEPRYLPRMLIHPEPRVEPRRVVESIQPPCPEFNPATATCAPEPPTCTPKLPSPIQPPWAVLPWPVAQQSPRVVKVVKVLQPQPDNTCRGTILDRFL